MSTGPIEETTNQSTEVADGVTVCALSLVEGLGTAERAACLTDFSDPAWTEWSYLPGDRPGLALEHADRMQVDAVIALVDASLSKLGAKLVRGAIDVERARRLSVTGVLPTSDRYWVRVLEDPGKSVWAWRLNGHHVGLHVTVDGSDLTFTPLFIGSEPARISSGPLAGTRLLGPEEDLARDLLAGLDDAQRQQAVATGIAPADILTGMDPVVDPSVLPRGIRRGDLESHQRPLLDALVQRYLDRLPAAYARRWWTEAVGKDSADLEFSWAGSLEVGSPHYYCVRSSTLLIEYDNTQDDANHAHSVLRHLRDDFGGDVLRAHSRAHHRTAGD
ncbi:DUF3500 domain-containing protein [Knoellia subterranea]|uniref:DUF3500 domain-containing protein n=1 Tax=Knoellia subterranea KCTC 19937 TaxID=1385521 RepID=A0A0A0JS73_9MICO|nr:DUF3500 domain-containing protein [Knoellia subterranea]KGN38466.1 hypothetical protein N803_06905 [Knoellia subterranea KCTC 19937]